MPNLPHKPRQQGIIEADELVLIYLIVLAVSIQLHSKYMYAIPKNIMQTDLPYCCPHINVKFEGWIKNLKEIAVLYVCIL